MPVRNWIPKEAQMLVILADMISLKKSLTKEIRNRRTGRRKGPFLNKDFRLKKLSGQQRKPRMPAWGLKKATHLQNDMCHSFTSVLLTSLDRSQLYMTFSYLTCLAHVEVRDDVGGYMDNNVDYDSCGVVVPNLFQSNVPF